MGDGKITEEWRTELIVPLSKRKGDVHEPGKYRGTALLRHVLKLLERILDGRIRALVEGGIGEEQLEFKQGRGTTKGVFALRQLVKKKLEGHENMRIRLIDMEKVYVTIPREMQH